MINEDGDSYECSRVGDLSDHERCQKALNSSFKKEENSQYSNSGTSESQSNNNYQELDYLIQKICDFADYFMFDYYEKNHESLFENYIDKLERKVYEILSKDNSFNSSINENSRTTEQYGNFRISEKIFENEYLHEALLEHCYDNKLLYALFNRLNLIDPSLDFEFLDGIQTESEKIGFPCHSFSTQNKRVSRGFINEENSIIKS